MRIATVFAGGVLLSFVLYILTGAILVKGLELRKQAAEAQHSATAYYDLAESFRAKDYWRDFVAIPIIGCLIGVYVALFQRNRPSLWAIACLLPMFAFEIIGEPVRTWSALQDVRYFGMRAVALLLSIAAASILRGAFRRAEYR